MSSDPFDDPYNSEGRIYRLLEHADSRLGSINILLIALVIIELVRLFR